MKKTVILLLALVLVTITILSDPQYYNYNNGTLDNSYPFGITSGKLIQTLIGPGEFNNPTPAPNGIITGISFRISSVYPISGITYQVFRILVLDTNLTTLPESLVNGNWDTVFNREFFGPVNAPVNTWLDITLDHPHTYLNSKSLVISVEQCAAPGASGFPLRHTNTPGLNRRTYTSGCGPFYYSGTSEFVSNVGIEINQGYEDPEYIYYKFERNVIQQTISNCAFLKVGYYDAPLGAGTPLTSGGQFDSCISGTGLTTGGVTTGWNCNFGSSSWTISMWLSIPSTSSGSAYYLFGDAGSGSFRCFHNGVALQDNLILRGPFNDVTVTGIGPAPTVVTFVYDSAAATLKAYKNGVLAVTTNQSINLPIGTGLKVGGYGTSPSFVGKIDEFRLYHRALTSLQVILSYNINLFCYYWGIDPVKNQNGNANQFSLKQNYPNPFNPATQISFAIPLDGLTKLAVYDILGKEIYTLVYSYLKAGSYSASFNASNIASGTYFYTLTSGDYTATKKMVIIK